MGIYKFSIRCYILYESTYSYSILKVIGITIYSIDSGTVYNSNILYMFLYTIYILLYKYSLVSLFL